MALLSPNTNKAFDSLLHRATAHNDGGMAAILKKDHAAQMAASEEYFRHWDDKSAQKETEADRAARTEEYASLTRQYYNLATDFYEFGFGQSFHFYSPAPGESFSQGLIRHEHYLAHAINIRKDMKVLDVGCGVGGPAREIAKFTGCRVTGLNINEYQVQRAARYAKKVGMEDRLEYVQGDFMSMPFADASFDAAYAIEATVHAPSLAAVYGEILRTLKPGGVFGVYEWVMTDAYDNSDMRHRKIRIDIEQGDGIANMVKRADALSAMAEAGFELLEHEDLADRSGAGSPWYWPLDGGSWAHAQTPADLLFCFRMTRLGRLLTHLLLAVLETVGLAPPGSTKVSSSLCKAADALVLGGKEKLFTPMLLMVGRKPLDAET